MSSTKDHLGAVRRRYGTKGPAALAVIAVVAAVLMSATPAFGLEEVGLKARYSQSFWSFTDNSVELGPYGLELPVPPLDSPYNASGTKIVITFMCVLILVGAVMAVRDRIKGKSWLPLLVALSGVTIVIPEVFVDIVGCVWYPTSPHDIAFTLFGRQMGWFILAGWTGFGSIFCYQCFKLFSNKKLPTKAIWGTFLAAAIGDVILEELIIATGQCYVYYGNQPLIMLWHLPWWWIPCNSGGIFLAAAIAARYKDSLQGLKGLLMLIITPLSVAACYGAIALPSWIVVNGDYSWALTQAAGLATITLGIVFVAGVIHVILERNPFDLKATAKDAAAEFDAAAGVRGRAIREGA